MAVATAVLSAPPIGPMIGVNIGCLEDVSEATLAVLPLVYVDNLHGPPSGRLNSRAICEAAGAAHQGER